VGAGVGVLGVGLGAALTCGGLAVHAVKIFSFPMCCCLAPCGVL
jgi:hypothetical protein